MASPEGARVFVFAALSGFAVDAVDTTGAGDMYAAGFLYGLSNDMALDKCGKIGSYAASKIVQILGARLESKLDIEKILNES